MLLIRSYEEGDQVAVWDLHVLALTQTGAYLDSAQLNADLYQIEKVYLNGRGEFLVAFWQERLVAMGALRQTDLERAEIKRMRVHPDFQKRGFGQLILEMLEEKALQLGYAILHLDTSVLQEAAQRLYLKNGFQPVKHAYIENLECIFYEKRLDNHFA